MVFSFFLQAEVAKIQIGCKGVKRASKTNHDAMGAKNYEWEQGEAKGCQNHF